ncbi:hypothetical protein P171DRAFT_224264 [Karstenula rhodostoma CBS 690.94]|uniref:Uncharacterized protein n=1 Tax=Karstenula rhodostoma CBS 690.94 TaxID=1392251 RepID=A0A9P4UD33_9PLEO|nr:hypothetical protein P171DRAFT_224264 [Karstenula rhodostoma CBS 690.94]
MVLCMGLEALDLHIALHIRDARGPGPPAIAWNMDGMRVRGRAPQRATRGCRHSCLMGMGGHGMGGQGMDMGRAGQGMEFGLLISNGVSGRPSRADGRRVSVPWQARWLLLATSGSGAHGIPVCDSREARSSSNNTIHEPWMGGRRRHDSEQHPSLWLPQASAGWTGMRWWPRLAFAPIARRIRYRSI